MDYRQLEGWLDAPLSIENIRVLRGANYFSGDKVIVLRLDLGSFDEVFTNQIQGFYEALSNVIPSLVEHHCSPGHRGGFLERVQEGTLLGHVTEHIAIELQTLAGMDVSFGKTRKTATPGVYNVVFRYFNSACGVYTARWAVHIVNSLLLGKPVDITVGISELQRINLENPDPNYTDNPFLVSITGSYGKSALKELLEHALRLTSEVAECSDLHIISKHLSDDDFIVEMPLERIMEEGLFYQESLLGVVLNIRENHRHDFDFTHQDDVAYAKSVVAEQVRSHGYAVLNADDPAIMDMVHRLNSRLAFFSCSAANPMLEPLRNSVKHIVVAIEDNQIAIWHRNQRHIIVSLSELYGSDSNVKQEDLYLILALTTCLYCLQKKPDGLAEILMRVSQ